MNNFDDVDINYLVCNRKSFDDFIYTPLDIALEKLKTRKVNKTLEQYINLSIPIELPAFLKEKSYAFLSRDLATPNYETRRFVDIVGKIDGLLPLFWEYYQDKFTPNVNIVKYNLAKPSFHFGVDKKDNERVRRINVVDFNVYNGKKISDIKTLWGQSLIDFHHEFLEETYLRTFNEKVTFFDASNWYSQAGGQVKEYYKYILTLFLRNGILFENFLLSEEQEVSFIKQVFFPAFISICKECGEKPLIVALAPTEVEGSNFWMYYPGNSIEFVKNKINLL